MHCGWETLDFHEFGSVLVVVAAIINARPLSVWLTPEGNMHSLAPRDVLFGRAGGSVEQTDQVLQFTMDQEDQALARM